jgi:hypothetical protein
MTCRYSTDLNTDSIRRNLEQAAIGPRIPTLLPPQAVEEMLIPSEFYQALRALPDAQGQKLNLRTMLIKLPVDKILMK